MDENKNENEDIQDETIQNESIQDGTVQDEEIQDEGIREDSVQDEGIQEPDEAAAAGEKKKRRLPVPLIIVLVICVVVFAVSIWQLANIFIDYREGEDEYEDLLQYVTTPIPDSDDELVLPEAGDGMEIVERVALSELKAQNPDTVAWLEIPGTGISYPVMHTTDNSYYLNHTFSRNQNSAGCLFVETLNSGDFSDYNTIVYGHNMRNGSMFAALKNYSSPSYLVAHPTVYLDLADGTHAYQIFSVYEASPDSDSYTIGFAPDEIYQEYLDKIKARSEYDTGVEVTIDDHIITLSTCTTGGQNRYLVHAKRIY